MEIIHLQNENFNELIKEKTLVEGMKQAKINKSCWIANICVVVVLGTYSTILFRKAYMNGVLNEMGKTLPEPVVTAITESFDGTFKFFGTEVSTLAMFLIMIGTCILLFGLFILLVNLKNKKKK